LNRVAAALPHPGPTHEPRGAAVPAAGSSGVPPRAQVNRAGRPGNSQARTPAPHLCGSGVESAAVGGPWVLPRWEREERIPLADDHMPKHFECGLTFPLSQREGRGEGERVPRVARCRLTLRISMTAEPPTSPAMVACRPCPGRRRGTSCARRARRLPAGQSRRPCSCPRARRWPANPRAARPW
jgi:hypothetical protein